MTTKITVTEASRNWADILNRVRYQKEDFILQKGGKSFAVIRPHSEGITAGELSSKWVDRTPMSKEESDWFAEDLAQIRKSQDLPVNPWENEDGRK